MPHYANGEQAHVGDVVRGTTYNQVADQAPTDEKVGVILEITSQADSCNAVVGWSPKVLKIGYGAHIFAFERTDYTEVRKLTKLAGADGRSSS